MANMKTGEGVDEVIALLRDKARARSGLRQPTLLL
jgi:hypothetical protein